MTKNKLIVQFIDDIGSPNICSKFTYDKEWELKRCNIIYGLNATGKSSIARKLLACNESWDAGIIPYPGIMKELKTFKVFNADFIKKSLYFENLDAEVDAAIAPIYAHVGLEAVEAKKGQQLTEKNRKLKDIFVEEKDKLIGERLSACSLQIRNQMLKLGRSEYKSFDRKRIKKVIDEFNNKITSGSWVPPQDIDSRIINRRDAIKEEAKDTILKFSSKTKILYKISTEKLANIFFNIDKLSEDNILGHKSHSSRIEYIAQTILDRTVTSDLLPNLKDNAILNNWVKEGIRIHNEHKDSSKCLYCENPITEERIQSLKKHFDASYSNLESNINIFIEAIMKMHINIDELRACFSKGSLYNEFEKIYDKKLDHLIVNAQKYNSWLDGVKDLIESKRNKMSCSVPFNLIAPSIDIQSMVKGLDDVVTDNN